MKNHRLSRILLLLPTLIILPCHAAADQGGRLVGVDELPAFVRERVELTPGTFVDGDPPAEPRVMHRTAEDAGAR